MSGKVIPEAALAWVLSGDTGLSSEAIWAHMVGAGRPRRGWRHPYDPDDIGRCFRLLESVPEWKPRIGEMAARSPHWAALVERWDEIRATMDEEVGIAWQKGHKARRTYYMMSSILDAVRTPSANASHDEGER